MKLALTAASLLLIAGGAVACGSDDADSDSASDDTSASASAETSETTESSEPSEPSESEDDAGGAGDFCAAFEAFATSLSANPDASEADQIKALKEEAEKLGDVDVPEGIPGDAEDGFETVIDAIADLPDDATAEDLTALESGFSDEEKANADAFDTYLQETCPDLGGSAESVEPAPSLSPAPSLEAPSE